MVPPRIFRFFSVLAVLLAGTLILSANDLDDTLPDVTDRVARISAVDGDVQIKRADTDEWERVVLNLPVVEGDEIVSAEDSRFEIQFSTSKHLRVSSDSFLRIVTMRDDGIAIGLSQGKASIRLLEFDPQAGYFEVDAPGTTVAFQRSGRYRLDAEQGTDEVVVGVLEGGEARIYSSTSGFTLRSGRSARVFTDGRNAGDWEVGSLSHYGDDLDEWALERESVIARRLNDAYYDRYYDRDIYGADELSDHGQWIHTREYGYIWQPFSSATAGYSDWSPYRYGHWRWIPAYGWTWVNDEPWGWATYHHGRWIWYKGRWYWSPYGYYRYGRSWWRPALVVMTVYGGNICWYPLPYHYRYYNYNRHYYSRYPRRGNRNPRPRTGNPGNTPAPSPTPQPGPTWTNEQRLAKRLTPPLQNVPPTAVVTVPTEIFGRDASGYKRPPLSTANQVLTKVPDDVKTPPLLPTYSDIKPGIGTTIRTAKPLPAGTDAGVKTGAAARNGDTPLDGQLRNARMLGNRPPLQTVPSTAEPAPSTGTRTAKPTGAVERPVFGKPSGPTVVSPGTGRTPREMPASPAPEPKSEPSRPAPVERKPAPRPAEPRAVPQPKQDQPLPAPSRRADPPLQREQPRPSSPPQRSEPRPDPPKRSDPPPQKSEPARPAPSEKKGKDG